VNWLKKGPELKKPNFEVPPFLGDLYYDLRERRLLPILALAVIAIAAVPFLLGGSSDEEEPTGRSSGSGASVSGASGTSSPTFTVVESKPGLRDYRKRLSHRSPTNPFKQRFTAPDTSEAELSSAPAEEASVTGTGEEGSTTIEPESSGPSGGSHSGLVFFAWAIDVKITKSEGGGGRTSPEQKAAGLGEADDDGGVTAGSPVELASDAEPTIRHNVLPQTKLPGDKQPVVTYMGRSKKGFPLFLVSSKVSSVFGESKCVSGDDSCQLLEVAPEFPITFVYGANEVHYTFNVLKIELVVTGHS
jgi:hypothetical protein